MKSLIIALLVICLQIAVTGQTNSLNQRPIALTVKRIQTVDIDIRVTNVFGRDLIIPYYEEYSGVKRLSLLKVRVEEKRGEIWYPARKNENYIFGDRPTDKVLLLKSGSTASFYFVFSVDWLKVKKGQVLRLVINAWPPDVSVKEKDLAIPIVTPEFLMP